VKRRATSENPRTLYPPGLVGDLSVVSKEAKIKKNGSQKTGFSSYWYLQ